MKALSLPPMNPKRTPNKEFQKEPVTPVIAAVNITDSRAIFRIDIGFQTGSYYAPY